MPVSNASGEGGENRRWYENPLGREARGGSTPPARITFFLPFGQSPSRLQIDFLKCRNRVRGRRTAGRNRLVDPRTHLGSDCMPVDEQVPNHFCIVIHDRRLMNVTNEAEAVDRTWVRVIFRTL